MQVVHSVGDFSPPGKCDRMNDMQLFTCNCLLLKNDSILLCASSLICIRQKYKIADRIASANQALRPGQTRMKVDKAKVCMRVFSTLMPWSNKNKSCMRVDES